MDYAPATPETVAPGATARMSSRMFAGAKVVNLLDRYEAQYHIPQFDKAVDFGWFYFLTKPIFYALDYLNGLLGNFGLAIMAFTVCVKLLFFPLANYSYRSMSKMQLLAPKIQAMRDAYKDDPQKQQQEMMALYKAEKVNPASGCLPMLVQIPVFFSLYKVIFVTIEMRQAPFYRLDPRPVGDGPDQYLQPVRADPVATPRRSRRCCISVPCRSSWGCTMFAQQKLNPPPPDPVQAQAVPVHADHLHLHAGALPGRPGDLLDLEQPAVGRAAMGDHAAHPAHPAGTGTLMTPGRGGEDTPASAEAALEEAGRLLFAGPCDFFYAAQRLDQLPPVGLTEVAFAGRSNVGKSSLLNALTGRRALARVSITPGRTRQLNFFNLGGRLVLVDMPGYGYARAGKDVQRDWQGLMFDYLRGRPTLRRVLLLLDARVEVKDSDRAVMDLLDRAAVTFQIVLTKIDDVHPGRAGRQAERGGRAGPRPPGRLPRRARHQQRNRRRHPRLARRAGRARRVILGGGQAKKGQGGAAPLDPLPGDQSPGPLGGSGWARVARRPGRQRGWESALSRALPPRPPAAAPPRAHPEPS